MWFSRNKNQSSQQDKRKIQRQNRRSFFETLERREVFANSVSVTLSAPQIYENQVAERQFIFTRTGDVATTAITVNYSRGGTAGLDQHYHDGVGSYSLDETVVFPQGVNEVRLPVTMIDNAIGDGTRTIIVTGTAGTGYTWSATKTATLAIDDNDVRLHVLNSPSLETGVAYFEVRLLTPGGAPISSSQEITFKFDTEAGTATQGTAVLPGVDYLRTTRTITIPAGVQSTNQLPESSQIRINIPINSDTAVEGDETFLRQYLVNAHAHECDRG